MATLSPGRAWVGIGPPNVLSETIVADPSGLLDLTQVLGVNFLVTRSDYTTATWACNITAQSSAQIVCQHPFSTGDCTVEGTYTITPQLVFSSGPSLCLSRKLKVGLTSGLS